MSILVENIRATTACFRLSDISSDVDASAHPNKQIFKGTLLLTDIPSDQSPFGAEWHKIMVPAAVAADKLSGLIGMGLNYEPKEMKSHSPRNKVGVIDKAWIEGAAVKVSGWIWKKDYPEAANALKGKSLGMSMELANVMVRDKDEETWYLEDFSFTGATALWPQSAAYHKTSLAAAKQAQGEKGESMPTKKKKTADASVGILAAAIGTAVKEAVAPMAAEMQENRNALNNIATILSSRQDDDDSSGHDVAASGEESPDVTEALIELAAAIPPQFLKKKKKDDDASDASEVEAEAEDASATDEEEDASSTEDDESEMDASVPSTMSSRPLVGNEVGHLNREKKQRGSKTSVTHDGPVVPKGSKPAMADSKARTRAVTRSVSAAADNRVIDSLNAATEMITTLNAQVAQANRTIKKQANRIDGMQAQLERYAQSVERRTLSPELTAIMNKSGYATSELMANGRKLRVDEVNAMMDRCGVPLDPQTRIAFKMQLEEKGLMENGVIDRSLN